MLHDEIEKAQRQVRTDALQMSLGEIVNMYRDGELIVNPDFQRLFRWEIGQKSRLFESILLGIPLPSIFVYENNESQWELVDGLQRVSTILEFMGYLVNSESKEPITPSVLSSTKYLPSLKNTVWEVDEKITEVDKNNQIQLANDLKLAIRRARISVEILKRPSDSQTKYDLFQRLNSGGTPANPQELRNCLINMVSTDFSRLVKEMEGLAEFNSTCTFTDPQRETMRPSSWVCRFLVHSYIDFDGKDDVEEFISKGIVSLASGEIKISIDDMKDRFISVFTALENALSTHSFKRMDENGNFVGRTSLAAFECIAIGVSRNWNDIARQDNLNDFIIERVNSFWRSDSLDQFFRPGLNGVSRIKKTIPFGEEHFRP